VKLKRKTSIKPYVACNYDEILNADCRELASRSNTDGMQYLIDYAQQGYDEGNKVKEIVNHLLYQYF
jgi:hypothetical protein